MLAADGIDAQARVLHGDPDRSLPQFASQLPAAFIVMATHRPRESVRAGIGNIAAHTVRRAPCPVLVVRAGLSS